MLRGIFIACKASKDVFWPNPKDVIIKRLEVTLKNQHIIHRKLEIAEPLEEFDETEVELVDSYGSLTTEELAYFQMGEAWGSNVPHGNNNNKNDDDESEDGEEDKFLFTVPMYWLLSVFRFYSYLMLWNLSWLLFMWF
jgi:hypothetical protein